jgi:hypothetical protein
MARAPKKEVMSWQDKMKQDAAKQAEMEKSTGGGKFFSMRAGTLKFDDVELPGNQLACVILHGIYENVFYEDKFDPDNKTPPTCFAFWDPESGQDVDDMAPHEEVDKEDCFSRQADTCAECPQNEWGSADKGKGKACSNRRRLAIIPAGIYKSLGKNKGLELEMFTEAEDFAKSDIAFMKLPVTSVKKYSAFVREISEQLGRPTWAVFANIEVTSHERYQVAVDFELLDEVPDELMDVVFKRHLEAVDTTAFPYRPPSDDEEEGGKKAAPAKKVNSGRKLSGAAKTTGRQRAKK